MNAKLILLDFMALVYVVMCSEVGSVENSGNKSVSCVSIISNKSNSLDCLLFINSDSTHYGSHYDCTEYSHLSGKFLSSGDVRFGFKILTACHDTYTALELCSRVNPLELDKLEYNPEDLDYVCSFYEEAYQLALQQDMCKQLASDIDLLRKKEQSEYTTEFMRAKYITELKKLYTGGLKLKNRMDNLSHVLDDSFVTNITGSEMKKVVEEGMEFNKDLNEYRTLLYYVYGPVDISLFVVGFVSNIILIVIFIRYKEVRTPQNMLLLNLALGDILNLLSNIVTALIVEVIFDSHFTYFDALICKSIACFQFISIGLSVYAMMFLSIQRYILVRSSTKFTTCKTNRTVVPLHILAVWLMSVALAIPATVLTIPDSFGICFIPKDFDPTLWNTLFIGGIPIVVVTCFYTLTACRLARSARNMPGETRGSERTRKARNRGAGVLIGLTAVFAFSYLPYCLYLFLLHSKFISPPSYWYEYALFKLTFLNPVLNPFALFFGSGTFKRHLKMCFTGRRDKSQVSTDSKQTKVTGSSKWTYI